ncbi:MAG: hypothetical protein AB7U07_01045 [Thermoleophilia bacterium]
MKRVAAVFATAALAGAAPMLLGTEAEPTPAPAPAPKVPEVTPAKLRAQLVRERRAHRQEVARLKLAVKAAPSLPYFVWWSTHDTRKTAEAVWDEAGVSASERAYWSCIVSRESGWKASVWYGGLEGWQPQYAGTDRVNGLLQLRPYHADLPDDAVVSYATFLRTSDPVFALRKALRLGHGPFFASNGGCQ